jgi:DNA-binding FadR family transcriptional regulator
MRSLIITMLRVSYEYGVLQQASEPVSREGHIRVAQAIQQRNGKLASEEMARMLELNRRDAIGDAANS